MTPAQEYMLASAVGNDSTQYTAKIVKDESGGVDCSLTIDLLPQSARKELSAVVNHLSGPSSSMGGVDTSGWEYPQDIVVGDVTLVLRRRGVPVRVVFEHSEYDFTWRERPLPGGNTYNGFWDPQPLREYLYKVVVAHNLLTRRLCARGDYPSAESAVIEAKALEAELCTLCVGQGQDRYVQESAHAATVWYGLWGVPLYYGYQTSARYGPVQISQDVQLRALAAVATWWQPSGGRGVWVSKEGRLVGAPGVVSFGELLARIHSVLMFRDKKAPAYHSVFPNEYVREELVKAIKLLTRRRV